MKPTLFVLAAGMGSRYGGLKQLDGLGPHGETIMDYSIYDAIHSGFGKVVFVIRHDFEQEFRDKILSKYESKIPTEVVFQSVDALPEGFACPEDRTKPWGTNHAVLMGKDVIKEPFAVINSDDFYGRNSFEVLAKALSDLPADAHDRYFMVGFNVGNTMSESGTVSRGGKTEVFGGRSPAAATINAVSTLVAALGIAIGRILVVTLVVNIPAPFPYVARHIEEANLVSSELAYIVGRIL